MGGMCYPLPLTLVWRTPEPLGPQRPLQPRPGPRLLEVRRGLQQGTLTRPPWHRDHLPGQRQAGLGGCACGLARCGRSSRVSHHPTLVPWTAQGRLEEGREQAEVGAAPADSPRPGDAVSVSARALVPTLSVLLTQPSS